MEASKILIRSHQTGDIMSGVKKGWSVEDSLTCKRTLVKIFRRIKYNRDLSKSNKYTEKGITCEEDGITLYSRVKKKMFKKNTERLTNDFFSGELDLFEGKSIREAEETHDIKCSWSLDTFPSLLDTPDYDYVCQGQSYLDLTGAKRHTIAYCLVNATPKLIDDAKRKKSYELGVIDTETEEYISACKEIEKDMIFDMELFKKQNPHYDLHTPMKEWIYDIPMEERVITFTIERDEELIKSIKTRITNCRAWIDKNLLIKKQIAA
jgi:hypothetical protein